ncbi:prepilin peptidase [Streptomyces sp. NPDC051561]|uniref:prepilin peptidase n=1 Tax=Streptomyces sp. NPDC051561 TaxID=3365658 RepID=UPI0037960128
MLVTGVLTVAAALWGAAAGLLVPRAAYRLAVEPEEEWRRTCPAGHAFHGPARGWIGTARCARCATAVPVGAPAPTPATPPAPTPHPAPALKTLRYVLVAAAVCAALAAATGPRPELAVWLLLAPFALLLAVVDRRVHRLPDVLTFPLAGAAVLLLGAAELLPGDGGSWVSALIGGAGLGATYFVLFLVNPNGMGFGDVKLALGIGVALGWYGWPVLFVGALAGFVLGALYGVGLMITRRGGRKTAIPFGPFMLTGTWAGLLIGALGAG